MAQSHLETLWDQACCDSAYILELYAALIALAAMILTIYFFVGQRLVHYF